MKNHFQYDTYYFYLMNDVCNSIIGSETLGFQTNDETFCFQHPFLAPVLKFLTWLVWKNLSNPAF